MAADYSKIVEQYIKVYGSPADLYAGLVGATAASSAPEWAAAATNLVKVGDAFLSLIKEIPVIGNTTNAISLGLNLRLASSDIANLGYVSRTVQVALLGDVAAVASGLGFAAAATGVVVVGMSTPVLVAVAALAATVGIASTFYSATRGIEDKQLEQDIVKLAANAAEGLGRFNDISWVGTETTAVKELKESNAVLYPIVELLHILSPNLTVSEALKIVDASASGATLQEAAAVLNGVRKFITGQPAITVATPSDYLTALNSTFDATKNQVANYSIKPWPDTASALYSLALTSQEVRAAMVLGTPFYITGLLALPISASELSLLDATTGQGAITPQWLQDRSAYITQLSQARISELQSSAAGYISVQGNSTENANIRYVDSSSGTKVEVFANRASPTTLPNKYVMFGSAEVDVLLGDSEADRLYGGSGADILKGNDGNDYLEGNLGDDEIYGEVGNDTLIGGHGTDTYTFTSTFGHDTILDSDGLGIVQIEGVALDGTGTVRLRATAAQPYTVWETDSHPSGPITYRLNTVIGELTITTSSGSVTVKNFKSGNLGINAPEETPTAAPVPQTTFNLSTDEGRGAFYAANTTAATDHMRIEDSATPLNIYASLAGVPPAWRSTLVVRSGSGNDVIEGGASVAVSGMVLGGGAGDDQIYATVTQSVEDAISRGEAQGIMVPSTSRYMLDGGAGADQIIGSDASDVLLGGEGDDILVAGHGNDIILADGDAGAMLMGDAHDTTVPWIIGANDPRLGVTAQLQLQHAGVMLGLTATDATGQRTAYKAEVAVTFDPLSRSDFSGLAALIDTDIRGLGYSASGLALTVDQQIGEKVNYRPALASPFASNRGSGDDIIFAGAGDDVVNAGAGDDLVVAGSGRDMVAGYEGDDFIEGGDGDDRLLGDMYVEPGDGAQMVDEVDFFTAKLLSRNTLAASQHGEDYIDGGQGNDILIGGGKADTLFGGEGNDTLLGDGAGIKLVDAGEDYLDGEEGNDTLSGGAKSDSLYGGIGNDVLIGDTANDAVEALGDDYLDGEAGDDELSGGGGADILLGGAGKDALYGDGDDQTNDGSSLDAARQGNDFLDGGDDDDSLWGDGGDDVLLGGQGNDYLDGGAGADQMDGGKGADILFGGGGNDTLKLDGADFADGGAGDDTYTVSSENLTEEGVLQVAYISDTQGRNTIHVDGGPSLSTEDVHVFVQNGQVMVALGDKGLVALATAGGIGHSAVQVSSGIEGTGSVALAAVVSRDDSLGRLRSGVWTAEGLISTRTFSAAQALQGSQASDLIEGGSGSDSLMGDLGDDELLAGEGNDHLSGGEGANVLAGGAGNDHLFVGAVSTTARTLDTIVFNQGDGFERVQLAADAAKGQQDLVLRFGEGITQADLTFSAKVSGGDTEYWLMLATGEGLAFAHGLAGIVQEVVFADGSSLDRQGWSAWLAASKLPGELIQGSGSLMGTPGNDQLRGSAADDVLIGGLGDDLLEGFGGRNEYRFGRDDGQDTVVGQNDETGVLRFTDANPGELQVTQQGDQIRISHAGSGSVTLLNANGDSQRLLDWTVINREGERKTVQELLQSNTGEPGGTNYNLRKNSFLAQQLSQLGALGQRAEPGFGSSWLKPSTVQSYSVTLVEGQIYAHEPYLNIETTRIEKQVVEYVKQYALTETTAPITGSVTFIPLKPLSDGTIFYQDQNQNVSPVYDGNGKIIGYNYFRFNTTPTPAIYEYRQVGVIPVVRTEISFLNEDSATQVQIIGTGGNDVVSTDNNAANFYLDYYQHKIYYPVLFRGSISTGAGDDTITLVSGHNDVYPQNYNQGASDWGYMATSNYDSNISTHYYRGLGAWIDAGTGNDTIQGTDANDIIIGGLGSDFLDGQAGSDTYVIGFENGVFDRVQDLAQFDWTNTMSYEGLLFESYGGDITRSQIDTVEFDESVTFNDLTYRLNSTRDKLFLFRGQQFFLEVNVSAMPQGAGISRAGIERFTFSDGTALTTEELIQQLTEEPTLTNQAPTIAAVASDVAIVQGQYLYLQLSNQLFVDPDIGDGLTWSVRLGDGDELPSWLQFDSKTRTLSGFPLNADAGELSLRIVVIDRAGASSSQIFTLSVSEADGAELFGSENSDYLFGTAGDDLIDGLGGSDYMSGNDGDDYYQVDNRGDVIFEYSGYGHDSIDTWVSYTLPSDVERLVLRGSANLRASGNYQDNELVGNGGSNRLDGAGGADRMVGRAGNDVYVVDNAGDTVSEFADEGTDVVIASVNYSLSLHVERLTLSGTETLTGTGNELANLLIANDMGSTLLGLGGNDTLRGGARDDKLLGGDGNDRLNGAEGADRAEGGNGNDIYTVDNIQDIISELAHEGTDTVRSSVSFTLGDNVERLTLTGIESLNGNGNDELNLIVGNAGNNTLNGYAGNDTIRGGAGVDLLFGGEGNDRLEGGTGADAMTGGLGDDTYIVDDTGDDVFENAGEGVDTVKSVISYSLGAQIERLTLSGVDALFGFGNDLANTISGNASGNIIRGFAGADILRGGAGADTLEGGIGNDRLAGGNDADIYLFARHDGQDTLIENDATLATVDVLRFGNDINAMQLWFKQKGDHLDVSIIGTGDRVRINNWYLGDQYRVERIELSDNLSLAAKDVQNLVQAMASFSPPPQGHTTLSASYQSSLNPVIAANWQ